ncbi:porin [Acinetobacter sp. C26M]|uniref:porin n=1 Tax=unclassified Acinetobacter TaxID=196816 RepID=UPI002036A0DC|nr:MULTISPECIES: porin [unclassified Acinetobacter]USA44988.1 porin [Acinetobacter sp. C26M]USA48491.1 porin [Acinetobacter sp. C26G]
MKKLLLAATVATLAMNAAQAAPTLYGKLNVTLDQIDKNGFKDESVTKVNSNASRIGVKGEEKLTDNLSAVYLIEWQFNADGDGDQSFSNRNRYVGIKSEGIGTLKVGQFDSYFKNAAGNNQDIFNDHNELDMTAVLAGEDRLKNVIGFETDKKLLGGLAFNIMFQQGEESSAADSAAKGKKGSRDGFGDGVSTSITYENKNIGLAAAVAGNFGVASKYSAYSLSDIYTDAIRVTGSLDLTPAGVDGLVFGALWQTAQPTDDTVTTSAGTPAVVTSYKGLQEDAYGVTAAYTIPSTPIKLKAEYISATTESDGRKDRKQDLYGVGADYQINKQTRFYGVVGQQKRDWLVKDDKKTTIGLGMEYNF